VILSGGPSSVYEEGAGDECLLQRRARSPGCAHWQLYTNSKYPTCKVLGTEDMYMPFGAGGKLGFPCWVHEHAPPTPTAVPRNRTLTETLALTLTLTHTRRRAARGGGGVGAPRGASY
jgi:hypothetical protein